jgi:hypothetical protein
MFQIQNVDSLISLLTAASNFMTTNHDLVQGADPFNIEDARALIVRASAIINREVHNQNVQAFIQERGKERIW